MIGSAADIVRQLHSGARTALSVLEETQAAIAERNPILNCFTATTFDRAAREASAIDSLRARGLPLPALAGVPYAVKNLFDVEGLRTLAGAKLKAREPAAAADAQVVTRMQKAGAVLVGTLNMDENAYGFTTENSHYGATRNPHDLERVAGGSSGGSAAAVAGGIVPLTLGTDTNGSIRVPASFCGVFGLKPTYGRLSRRGAFPLVGSLDHVGPFASGVVDLATVYDVLQGSDPHDPACAQRKVELTGNSLNLPIGLRIGVLDGWFEEWAEPVARRAVQLAASALRATAHVELKYAAAARAAAFIITGAEGGALHADALRAAYAEFEPASRSRLVAGNLIPASWVLRAQRVRALAHAEAAEVLQRFDLLLAPATPLLAPKIGSATVSINGCSMPVRASLGLLTQPISFIGLPVCSVPVWPDSGVTGLELPLGVQLIAAPWREDICLAAARALEQAGVAAFRLPRARAAVDGASE